MEIITENATVVIVSYNGMQWIEKCLLSVLNSSIVCEIVVVDNNSIDTTTMLIKEKFPRVILLEQVKNLGFGAANNIGVSYALKNNADFVFLLNQDAYLQPQTLCELIKVYDLNKDYGIISPIHVSGDGSKLDKNFSDYLKVNDTFIFDSLQQNYSESIYQVPFVNAAAWLLPRKTLETIGGFDPIFYHYAEDDNYCQRLSFHKFKIGIVPNTYIFHDRDFRKPAKIINEKERLILKERYLKYRWANINIEVKDDIKLYRKNLFKLRVKLFLKLKFKKLRYYKKEATLIKCIIPEIYKSRDINSQVGNHYL